MPTSLDIFVVQVSRTTLIPTSTLFWFVSYKLSTQTRTAIPQRMQFYELWHLVFHICVLLCTQKNLQFPFQQTL